MLPWSVMSLLALIVSVSGACILPALELSPLKVKVPSSTLNVMDLSAAAAFVPDWTTASLVTMTFFCVFSTSIFPPAVMPLIVRSFAPVSVTTMSSAASILLMVWTSRFFSEMEPVSATKSPEAALTVATPEAFLMSLAAEKSTEPAVTDLPALNTIEDVSPSAALSPAFSVAAPVATMAPLTVRSFAGVVPSLTVVAAKELTVMSPS